jgi:general bacterial porin, GBP family
MKKSLLALAALSTFAVGAHAQSTVTLYGIVDIGIAYTSNSNAAGKSTWAMASGNESGSRFGLTGAEDLGGGLKAIFKLENGFNPNNGTLGQGGRMFGRQAYVGLSSASFGTVTLGRQYNAVQDFIAPLDIASVLTQYATHPYDNDNLNNSFRSDNTVKYATPNIAGFQAEGLYGFSNSTAFAVNRTYSLGATYAMGPLNVAASYAFLQNPGVLGGSIVGSPSTTAATSNPNTISGDRVHQWGAGATYAFGPASFGLLYTGSYYRNSTTAVANTLGGGVHLNNYEGSFRYQLTPALVLAVGETYTGVRQSGVSGHFWQSNLGADYNLSKRTDVYLTGVYQRTTKNIKATIDASAGTASGQTQTLVVAGIRHKF